jgi:hypothetical protein
MIRKSTWIVLAVFVLALGGAVLWQRNAKQKEAQATPEANQSALLFDFGDAKLTGIRIERVGDKVVELKHDGEAWTAVWPEQPGPLDSATLNGTLGSLSAMATLTKLDEAPSPADMGLEPPVYRLLLKLSDGRQLVAAVGKTTPTGSGYYVQSSNQGYYVASKYSLEPLLNLVDTLPLQQPTETPNLATAPAVDSTPALTPEGTP